MKNILLIEPDYLLATVYKSALTNAGYNVVVEAGAQEGIMAADQFTPEIIILELQLIEHSGIEFLYELRTYSEWQNIAVIILSQVPPNEFGGSWEILQKELGVSFYLYKPHTTLKLLIDRVKDLSLQKV